ncbi:protein PAIR1-like [Hordeum vulgare subsp. vulgare]|uniref:protein PAIR1-like n=1 Tax=Hordeum vulgare subsp. vulgare TaxID=112509 RepID=UPI001D1A3B8A|nr:protein PAIR1-like [Hordeum vulgare subsp. vulgare]
MKEASLDSGSIQKKFVLLEDSLKQILKGQDDLKALFEGSTESNPDQLSVLNSHTRKLDEMSSILSALPNHVQTEFGQLKGDTYRILTKEMEVQRPEEVEQQANIHLHLPPSGWTAPCSEHA